MAKTGQGFAVKYYSFTLDALDLPAETGSASGILNFCNVRVNPGKLKDMADSVAKMAFTMFYIFCKVSYLFKSFRRIGWKS